MAAVRAATSVTPFVVGKPETYAFHKILEITGMPADRCVVVGDRLDTDMLVGNRCGTHTVLVLTGISSKADGLGRRAERLQAGSDYRKSRGACRVKIVLTIAASDSSCGAGIQADLAVFRDMGVYGVCAVTNVTAQNSGGVSKICKTPPRIVAAQIDAVTRDLRSLRARSGCSTRPDRRSRG